MTYVASSAPAFLSSWHTADNSSAALDTVSPPRQRKRFVSHAQAAEVYFPFTVDNAKPNSGPTRSGGETHAGANTIHSNQAVKILMHTEQLILSVPDPPSRATSVQNVEWRVSKGATY